VTDFIPGVSQVKSAYRAGKAALGGDYGEAGRQLVGTFVPGGRRMVSAVDAGVNAARGDYKTAAANLSHAAGGELGRAVSTGLAANDLYQAFGPNTPQTVPATQTAQTATPAAEPDMSPTTGTYTPGPALQSLTRQASTTPKAPEPTTEEEDLDENSRMRKYLDMLDEAPTAPQGSMSNMPGAKAYSDAADPMAAANAQYQQNMQNIQGEKDQRFLDHMAARDAYKAANGGKIDSLTAPMGPSGDPLIRSSVSTTDLKQKERQAGQEYTAANREKTGGGHWQYDKKTVDSEMGPITQTTARRIATPTKGEVIRQGLAGGGSLYDRQNTLVDPNAAKLPPGATGVNPTGQTQGQAPAIQSATTNQPATPQPTQPTAPAQQPTQPQQTTEEELEEELQKILRLSGRQKQTTNENDSIKKFYSVLNESMDNDEVDLHDSFDIELNEHFVIETGIVGFTKDGIIVEADETLLDLLELNSIICEDETMDQREEEVAEAEYQGRKVPLGKPMAGDVAKSKVYVKKPNGKVVKVNFGDKNMKIKKSNPNRRKSFRARHRCENPGPRWKARYWSCRAW
jgi:hypothetical protein